MSSWTLVSGGGGGGGRGFTPLQRCSRWILPPQEWTWERWQWWGTPHSPKLQHYCDRTVMLFSPDTCLWWGAYSSAEVHSVYSTAPADWAMIFVRLQHIHKGGQFKACQHLQCTSFRRKELVLTINNLFFLYSKTQRNKSLHAIKNKESQYNNTSKHNKKK